MLELYKKYKEMILYVVFGGLTTLVNIVVYGLMYDYAGFSNVVSTVAAWILSVLFAYITNKLDRKSTRLNSSHTSVSRMI